MASLLLIFALVLGIAGGFLLYYDRTQRASAARRDTASQQDTTSQYGPDTQRQDSGVGESDSSLPEQSPGGTTPRIREDGGNREERPRLRTQVPKRVQVLKVKPVLTVETVLKATLVLR